MADPAGTITIKLDPDLNELYKAPGGKLEALLIQILRYVEPQPATAATTPSVTATAKAAAPAPAV